MLTPDSVDYSEADQVRDCADKQLWWLQAYNSATADKRTTSQKSWDKAQVSF